MNKYIQLTPEDLVKMISETVRVELDKVLKTEFYDTNSIDNDVLTINKLVEHVGLLYVKHKRHLEFHEETGKEKKGDIETHFANLDLTNRLKQKITNFLSNDELTQLNMAINESVYNTTIQTTVKEKVEKAIFDKNEVARMFSVTTVTITDWMKKGILPYIRMNHRVYFTKSDIDRILATHAKRWRKP